MAPELQRLHMTAWMSRARSLERALPGHEGVERAVRSIARSLTNVAKLWWPGSVIALQLQATPEQVRAALELEGAGELDTWAEVALAAEEHAARVVEQTASRGLDEEGWADAAELTPAPPDAGAVVGEARKEIESVLGSIDERPQEARRAALAEDLEGPRVTLAAARKLRWARGAAPSPELWARALGRLRWAARQRVRGVSALAELLDAEYAPPQPWAIVLGRDPEAMERRRRRKRLIRDVPAPDAEVDVVRDWIVSAFDVGGDELPTDRIARHAAAFAATVDRIDADDLSSLHRKKLGKLRRHLGLVEDDGPTPDLEASSTEADQPEEPDPPPAKVGDPQEELTREIRRLLTGRQALFVSNRTDPDLQQGLEELLGLDLAWCAGDMRRVQSACERISGGTYDLVLCATGFSDHAWTPCSTAPPAAPTWTTAGSGPAARARASARSRPTWGSRSPEERRASRTRNERRVRVGSARPQVLRPLALELADNEGDTAARVAAVNERTGVLDLVREQHRLVLAVVEITAGGAVAEHHGERVSWLQRPTKVRRYALDVDPKVRRAPLAQRLAAPRIGEGVGVVLHVRSRNPTRAVRAPR